MKFGDADSKEMMMLSEGEENRYLDAMYGDEPVPNLHAQVSEWIEILTEAIFHLDENASGDMVQGDEDICCLAEMLRDDTVVGHVVKWGWGRYIREAEKAADAAAKRRAK